MVGVPDPTWGEIGVAFVVAADPAPAPEALAAFLQERLARFKLPRAYEFVQALPRTPYGKVVKGPLREEYLARHGGEGRSTGG